MDSTEKPGADVENTDEDQMLDGNDSHEDSPAEDPVEAIDAQSESDSLNAHTDDGDHADDIHHDMHYEEVHEERGTNWAARVLFWLLLLIAGAAGALWGGPKLAPQLPQWAAPAAKYLTPGGDAALAEAQALRTDVDTRLGDIDTRLADLPGAEAAEEAARGAVATFEERIAALEANAGVSEEMAALSTRMEEIEGRLTSLSGDVSGLSDALSTAAVEGGAISAETMADIAANATTMAGIQSGLETLTGDVSTLSTDIAGLTTRMDTFENETVEQAAAAEAAAAEQARRNAVENELDVIRAALDSGKPFGEQLEALAGLGIEAVPEALTAGVDGSLPTIGQLRSELTPLAHQAIRESIRSDASDSTTGRIGAFLQSQVATRSLEPGEGSDTDAVLSRIEAALGVGDLTTVLSEAEVLEEPAAGLLAPWIAKVGTRAAALDAISAIGAGTKGGS